MQIMGKVITLQSIDVSEAEMVEESVSTGNG